PVICGDTIPILGMSDHRALSCRLCVDFHGDLSVIAIEAFVAALTYKAGQTCDTGITAERLDISIENIFSARHRGNPTIDFDIVRIVGRRLAVLFQQTGDDFWRWAAAMACIASYRLAATKQILIDCVDNLDHPAGRTLYRDVVRILFPIAEDGITVA